MQILSNIDQMIDYQNQQGLEAGAEHVRLSMSAKVDDGYAVYDLDDVVIPGEVQIVVYNDAFWGGDQGENYFSPIVTDLTLRQLVSFADEAISKTRDFHHVFLEDVYCDEGGTAEAEELGFTFRRFKLAMGS